MKKIREFISTHFHKLMQIRDTPHAVAGGSAIGIFFSFTPLIGLRIVAAVLVAWLCRCSKAAALIAVNLHEVVFFLWPLVWALEYQVGYWLLHTPHAFPPHGRFRELMRLQEWHHQKGVGHLFKTLGRKLQILWPDYQAWLVGSLLIGLPISIVCYFVILKIVSRYQRARAAEDAAKRPVTLS